METLVKTNIIITIIRIINVHIGDRECVIKANTREYGDVDIYFEDVWECRYCIENAGIIRWERFQRSDELEGSIFEVHNSDYLRYFVCQTDGTLPSDNLKDYLLSDEIDTIFEVISVGHIIQLHTLSRYCANWCFFWLH